MSDRAALAAGDDAWHLVTEPIGAGARHDLRDAARVRVVEVRGDGYLVEVVRSGGRAPVGLRLEAARPTLYSCACPAEHAAFGELVRRLWDRHTGAAPGLGEEPLEEP